MRFVRTRVLFRRNYYLTQPSVRPFTRLMHMHVYGILTFRSPKLASGMI